MKNQLRAGLATALACAALNSCLAGAADWPQWRGPYRDSVVPEGSLGYREIALTEPKLIWKIPVGGGFSSPVISQGKLAYADAQGESEVLHVIDHQTGRELWQRTFSPVYQDEWGAGTRSTPFFDGDRVYAQSCIGEFACFEVESGVIRWKTSFEKDFGVKFLGSKAREGTASRRGNNGSGFVDGSQLILPVGATNGASLVCFDKLTGSVMWKGTDEEAAYSSLSLGSPGGRKQVVAFMADALIGADRATGRLLWRVPLQTFSKRHVMTPVIVGDDVYVNSHTFGMIAFRISRDGDGLKAEEVWRNRSMKINLATPVLVDDCFYSFGPAKNYVCIDRKTGQQLWSQPGFGKEYASTLAVGRKLVVLTDEGELVILEANPKECRELGRWQVCGKAWGAPAYSDGKFFVRDTRQLICLDLGGR